MTQEIIVWALLVALVGLIWVMVLAILVTTITPTTSGQETPRRNRMTERNHTNAHPGGRSVAA